MVSVFLFLPFVFPSLFFSSFILFIVFWFKGECRPTIQTLLTRRLMNTRLRWVPSSDSVLGIILKL